MHGSVPQRVSQRGQGKEIQQQIDLYSALTPSESLPTIHCGGGGVVSYQNLTGIMRKGEVSTAVLSTTMLCIVQVFLIINNNE
jgi:hypothetical protein